MESVAERTRRAAELINAGRITPTAMALRGVTTSSGWCRVFDGDRPAGADEPGQPSNRPVGNDAMSAGWPRDERCSRAAVRLGLTSGPRPSWESRRLPRVLIDGVVPWDLQWGDVEGWSGQGGRRARHRAGQHPHGRGLVAGRSRRFSARLDGLLIIGGTGSRPRTPWRCGPGTPSTHACKRPVIVLPSTIDNNLPSCDISVGADTALKLIVGSVDTGPAGPQRRPTGAFVVETMGGFCGYLALMAGLSGGAVRVYLNEEGVTLKDLSHDVERMVDSFKVGQRLFLTVMNEKASPMYTTDFLCRLFEQEGHDLFDARGVVLGQTQQGGSPTPFDRILGTRLAAHSIDWLSNQIDTKKTGSAVIGLHESNVRILSLRRAEELADWEHRRPVDQWWLRLRPLINTLGSRLAVTPARAGR